MKTYLLILALVAGFTAGAQSKDSDKTAAVKTLIESGKYCFKPTTALPTRGPVHQLTLDFDMTVTLPEKIVCNLPYYGRAYAPVDPTNGGMSFTTKNFDYKISPRKKGGWDITIKTKDQQGDNRQLQLTVTQDGYATLQAISTNRDPISYNGSVTPIK